MQATDLLKLIEGRVEITVKPSGVLDGILAPPLPPGQKKANEEAKEEEPVRRKSSLMTMMMGLSGGAGKEEEGIPSSPKLADKEDREYKSYV